MATKSDDRKDERFWLSWVSQKMAKVGLGNRSHVRKV